MKDITFTGNLVIKVCTNKYKQCICIGLIFGKMCNLYYKFVSKVYTFKIQNNVLNYYLYNENLLFINN